eukprot:m.28253 g.28253  ORF g.28253 m.28253 type:complete len:170 (+) comp9455_c0_seq1:70-579(+)
MVVEVDSSAIICRGATIQGDVTIGSGTIVHTTAKLIGINGPIIIGKNNMIEEQVTIENKKPQSVMTIGDGNVFEIGCKYSGSMCEANNVFEAASEVETEVMIGSHCNVGAKCKVRSKKVLDDRTIVYGENNEERINKNHNQSAAFDAEREFLQQNLQKFHPLLKEEDFA